MGITSKKIIKAERINTITNRIQKVYILFICTGTIGVISDVFGISGTSSQRETIEGAINLFLYFFVYIGLRLRKKWVIPLVLISSAFWLVSTFLSTFQQAVDILALLSKFGGIMLVLFCAYQIRFFSKPEVREFFGTKETIFF
jgi:hypothetical protein